MSDEIQELSDTVRSHLKKITRSSGLPDTEESFRRMAAVWLEKKRLFEGQIHALGMVEVDSFAKDDPRANFHLQGLQGGQLCFGKGTDVTLTEISIADELSIALGNGFIDLLSGELETVGIPVIEP